MNLTQLKYFQTVCEMGSVSVAAENLHISQPSLSIAIKELEKEFGVELFKRHYKGMALTDAGEKLYAHAQSLLKHYDDVARAMDDLGVNRKVLRLGVPPMIGSIMLPEIYRSFAEEHRKIELQITEAGRQELIRLLNENRLDMLLLPHNSAFGDEFCSLKVRSFEIVCCCNKECEISKKTVVSPSDLSGQPLVMFNDSFFQTQEIKKWFASRLEKPKILLQTNQLSTLQNMVKSGVACGFMFKEFIAENPTLYAIPLDSPITATVSLVWSKKANMYNAMKDFLNFIKNL